MEEKIISLNREKGTIKGKITRIENFLKSVSEPVQSDLLIELKVKLELMQSIQNDVVKVRTEYFSLPEKSDISEAEADLEDMEIRLEKIEVRLKTFLHKLNIKDLKSSENETKVSTNSSKVVPDVKLPKIILPTFSGNMYEWLTFKDLFKACVHDNANLSDGQKLQYLFSSLKGDALRVVKSISIADHNYKIAWSLLEDRYSNHREQVFAHIKRFMSIPFVQSESSSALLNLVDITFECIRSLEVLDHKVDGFADTVFVYILLQKLDPSTKLWFEREFGKKNDIPKLIDLIDFLKNYARTLDASKNSKGVNPKHYAKNATLLTNVKISKCKYCNDNHIIFKCQNFQNISVNDRVEFLKKHKLCFNCFSNHGVKNCVSKFSCLKCGKRHNTLIHFEKTSKNSTYSAIPQQTYCPQNKSSETAISSNLNPDAVSFETSNSNVLENTHFAGTNYKQNFEACAIPKEETISFQGRIYTFLSTAVINVLSQSGERMKIRALLDVGSQVSFLRKEIADNLKVKQQSINAPISGLNNSILTVKRKLTTQVQNSNGEFKKNIEFLVVDNITDLTLSKRLNISKVCFPKDINYADPKFYEPSKVDALLGADIFYQLLRPNQIKLNGENIVLQETVFGWVVSGSIKLNEQENYHCGLLSNFENVNDQLAKFWELEHIGVKNVELSKEEDKAQEIFNETVCFKNSRYEVSLPWKRNWEELGDNYEVAKKRLEPLTRKLKRDTSLYSEYCEILKGYLNDGIIEEVLNNEKPVNKPLYYLPHQVVIRKESITTKVRLVFDASSHEPGQLSLNDCLYQGTNLNPNIFNLLIFFRLNAVAFLADIAKAFLQISLCEKDRDVVRFLSVDNNGNTKVFRFRTIIFGVNVSPFLLAATIKEHIEKYRKNFPVTVQILNDCFYVDDLIAGSDDVSSALEISRNAKKIMNDAGMSLRKWISNSEELTKKWISEDFNQLHPDDLKDRQHRVLGLLWNPYSDCLSLEINNLLEFLQERRNTKRFLLMAAGRIFDPLGLMTPFTIRFKCLFQEIWERKLSWDEVLPSDISEKWMQWCEEVPQLKDLKIHRYVLKYDIEKHELEIHTFSDASAKAYGAVVYLKFKVEDTFIANIVASKSRVAPLKKLSLPRLELMGALLAARLASEVKRVIDKKQQSTSFFWTDSRITLYWIQGDSKKWKPFIENRVKEIQSLTDVASWSHCSGKSNPADILSRGASVNVLKNCEMWWKGPFLLKELTPETVPPITKDEYATELKKDYRTDSEFSVFLNLFDFNLVNTFINLSNNYLHILRVVSFVFRFLYNVKNPTHKKVGHLTAAELDEAEDFLIKGIQRREYQSELKCLSKGETVVLNSKIKCLTPFLDKQGLIRVGGRLQNSQLQNYQKHPVLLPQKSRLTNLIIMYFHKKCFHAGPQNLLYYVREKYWPIGGRNICRKICHECVVCFKTNPSTVSQLMGNLPPERVNPNFVFNDTGVDFCGPFLVKYKNQRKGTFNKVYVAIFVCLATRAIHLEIVTDLTTQGFISCLKRFFSRRGKSRKIFTDNAQTFVGAAAELKKLFNMVNSPDELLAGYLSSERIEWKFIPPKAPNFGGLWEAGVKSFKHHLKRVVGETKLTIEELLTIVIQIEGFLNSRPISPMSSDPNDYRVLSPGHFLIGREITSIPEPSLSSIPENRLSQWQKITKYVERIWQLWKREYLSNFQERTKWIIEKDNMKIGTVVLMKEENLAPAKWIVARVSEVFPGSDGKVRVVNVRLPNGKILKRSVRHICILPQQ